jgi:hypothetical protein
VMRTVFPSSFIGAYDLEVDLQITQISQIERDNRVRVKKKSSRAELVVRCSLFAIFHWTTGWQLAK